MRACVVARLEKKGFSRNRAVMPLLHLGVSGDYANLSSGRRLHYKQFKAFKILEFSELMNFHLIWTLKFSLKAIVMRWSRLIECDGILGILKTGIFPNWCRLSQFRCF